jgi:hypothetical protein
LKSTWIIYFIAFAVRRRRTGTGLATKLEEPLEFGTNLVDFRRGARYEEQENSVIVAKPGGHVEHFGV